MSKRKSAYDKLKDQGLSDEEIAELFVLPVKRTKKQQEKDRKELMEAINKRRNEKDI